MLWIAYWSPPNSIAFFRHALNVQIFIKMHRSDYAEKQLKIMQQIDEDHTLTQLANAWLDLAMVILVFNCMIEVILNYFVLFVWNLLWLRVVPRSRKHILFFRTSLRSIRWLEQFWMARLSVVCTWIALMRLSPYCSKHWTRWASKIILFQIIQYSFP